MIYCNRCVIYYMFGRRYPSDTPDLPADGTYQQGDYSIIVTQYGGWTDIGYVIMKIEPGFSFNDVTTIMRSPSMQNAVNTFLHTIHPYYPPVFYFCEVDEK